MRRPTLHRAHKQRLAQIGMGAFAGSGTLAGFSQQFSALPFVGPIILPTLATSAALGGVGWCVSQICAETFPPNVKLHCDTANRSQLRVMHDKLAEYTGALAVPFDEREAIFDRNRRCFRVILHPDRTGHKFDIVGMIFLYPLRVAAWRAMQAGDLLGRDIRAKHIVREWSSAAALYISFAWGDDFTAKGFVVRQLKEILRNSRKPVATRPTTARSLSLAGEAGFTKFDGGQPEMFAICWSKFQHLQPMLAD